MAPRESPFLFCSPPPPSSTISASISTSLYSLSNQTQSPPHMKRKKWSELEEQTLLSKYSHLQTTGALSKLKTREKKFRPIADHVNSLHHLHDPIRFPFRWSWRDVSIKVQNMRHQYLGVKQKIRACNGEFNWKDGEDHWENFLRYKEVFGDVELEPKDKKAGDGNEGVDFLGGDENGGDDVLNLGFDIYSGDDDDVVASEEIEDEGFERGRKFRKGLVGARILELRDVVMRREEGRGEREWSREEGVLEGEERRRDRDLRRDKRRIEKDGEVDARELQLEERQMAWARREYDMRLRLEMGFDEERRRRMKMEERWEEEEMEWRERMVNAQIEHEKRMMQMHTDACQNQMQILGVMARLVCQFFGSASDALGGGLGPLPPSVLQNLQHPGGLGDGGKPDASSPSEFL